MRSTGNFLRRLQSNPTAQAGFANDRHRFEGV